MIRAARGWLNRRQTVTGSIRCGAGQKKQKARAAARGASAVLAFWLSVCAAWFRGVLGGALGSAAAGCFAVCRRGQILYLTGIWPMQYSRQVGTMPL